MITTAAARYKAFTAFHHTNNGTMGSNLAGNIDICALSESVMCCVCTGFEKAAPDVLQNVYKYDLNTCKLRDLRQQWSERDDGKKLPSPLETQWRRNRHGRRTAAESRCRILADNVRNKLHNEV